MRDGVDHHGKNKRPGTIITFYSYKGGTGRSMALANVAWILASNGKRVLVIDWDLEAPGIHRYFAPFLLDPTLASSNGLIDFVNEYKIKVMTPPAGGKKLAEDWYVPFADLSHYAVPLEWDFPDGGRLDFIPAGRQDENYSLLVNSFNWKDFYLDLGGSSFLDVTKEKMRRDYDYILIDSRTGVSDTSGICTVKMPDTLVVCFTLNNQGIEGAANIANDVSNQRLIAQQPIQIFPVPMRVENAETEKRDKRMAHAKDKFSLLPTAIASRDKYWGQIPVIYIPYYAYDEILAAFGEQGGTRISLLASAEQLTEYLTNGEVAHLTPPSEEQRKDVLARYLGYPPEVTNTKRLINHAEATLLSLSDKEQQIAKRVLLRLISVARPGEVDGDTRQRVSLASLNSDEREVAETLSQYGLLETGKEKSANEPFIQIADEALIKGWKRLQDWVDNDREFLQWRQDLYASVIRWNKGAGDKDDLLRGHFLSVARANLLARPEDLCLEEKQFIQASIDHRIDEVRDDFPKEERTPGKLRLAIQTISEAHAVKFLLLLADRQSATLALALTLLIASGVFGFYYWSRLNRFADITSSMLNSTFEETPQAYKGIEAFMLADVGTGVKEELEDAQFTKEFIHVSGELSNRIEAFTFNKNETEVPEIHVADGENDGLIWTDKYDGFLFLPVPILRPTLTQEQLETLRSGDAVKKEEVVNRAIRSDVYLQTDINFSKSLSSALRRYTDLSIVKQDENGLISKELQTTPAQVYLITKNGTNRIFSRNISSPYYGDQFSPTTFFPSRPYYLATFKNLIIPGAILKKYGSARDVVPRGGATLGEYFYISRPYMDLGGNGIVITLSRGIVIDGVLQAVICFDLPFRKVISSKIEDRIRSLDGEYINVICSVSDREPVACTPDRQEPNELQKELGVHLEQHIEEKVKERNRDVAFGNIQIITPADKKRLTRQMEISIPIAPVTYDRSARSSGVAGSQKANFLLVNLDLERYNKKTLLFAVASFVLFGLALLLFGHSLMSTIRYAREYKEALSRVGRIMYNAPTPYVRLDDADRLIDLNLAFCSKLGYSADALSIEKLKKYTLESLCADVQSYKTYERVQELRRNNKEVTPYTLNLRTRYGYPVSVRIVSAGIPAARRGDLPETFGVMLDGEETLPNPQLG